MMKEDSEALVRKLNEKVEALAADKDKLTALNQELEARLNERNADLEQTNKELETFAYSVSHDLRAPLRAIDGLTLAAMEDFPKVEPAMRDLLERVRANARHMNGLIDGLLQFSRISQLRLRLEKVDLALIAREIVTELKAGGPGRQVQIEIAEYLPVAGDRLLVRTVMRNLIDNAWKFTSKKASARIEIGKMENEASAAQEASTVFFIRDNGVGFDMAFAGKLFGAFQRLHSRAEFPGNGVGLTMVQRILRRHGGRIWAEAKPDEGATFYFAISGHGIFPHAQQGSAVSSGT
jgi:light-regulated signal transduction histidine kinase (bacteriophytochrome)